MSMNPPGSNEPPQAPGQGVPPGYSPPPGGFSPPGASTPPPSGGFTPPGSGGFTPPGGGFSPPGGGGVPAPGGFSPPPGGGYQPMGSGFGTPTGQLAEWPQRALGGLIDYVGPAILIWIIVAVSQSFALWFLLSILNFGWGAFNGYLNGSTGQSIGKKVTGLKVIGEQSGQVIGGGMGLARWAVAGVLGSVTCGLFMLVDLLFPLWDAKKQTLHDKIFKSLVIVVPK